MRVQSAAEMEPADFPGKFEELIESHDADSRNIEELLKLSRNLGEEPRLHVRENMTEEERVILDFLTRPAQTTKPFTNNSAPPSSSIF